MSHDTSTVSKTPGDVPWVYSGFTVIPTEKDGQDEGGAKTAIAGKLEVRLTRSGAVFLKGLSRQPAPFKDVPQLYRVLGQAVEALQRYQDAR